MLQLRNYVAPVSSRRVKCFADKLTPVSFIVNPFIRSFNQRNESRPSLSTGRHRGPCMSAVNSREDDHWLSE